MASSLVLLSLTQPAAAHPHVFVDTSLELEFAPDGRAEAIKITWTYDELFTLSVLEDRNLDPDGDGVLTDAETAALQGFDMQWPPDFPGNTYVLLGDKPLELSGPSAWTARVEGGQVTTTHLRHLLTPVRPESESLFIKSYDPEHYYAYSIVAAKLTGQSKGCGAVVFPYDQASADAALSAASAQYAASSDPNAPFPNIGEYFSDKVGVGCPKG
jgi:ABC-type uncharacterized transport system substrate-binding protein